MKDRKERLKNISIHDEAALIPGFQQPLVELCGDRRVFVENHRGVFQYSTTDIGIRVSFGFLHVCGTELCLKYMSKDRLVVCGSIESIGVVRRIAHESD